MLRKSQLEDQAPAEVCEKDLICYFSLFGKIEDLTWTRDALTNAVKGYGFVTFGSRDSFQEAVSRQYHKLNGRLAEVFPVSERQAKKRMILVKQKKDAKGEMTVESVQNYFSAFGEIEGVDARKLQSKQSVIVTFTDEESVQSVLSNKQHEIAGGMVFVSRVYSCREYRQKRIEQEISQVKILSNWDKVNIAEQKARQVVVKIPKKFKDYINEENLTWHFSSFGEIDEACILRNKSNESRGIGFVAFKDFHIVEEVLASKKHEIGSAEIYVERSLTADEKTQSKSKKRSVRGGFHYLSESQSC